jgi:hypothetical protein
MAKVKSGFGLGLSGTIGGVVYTQQPDGSTTVRDIAVPSKKPKSDLQKSTKQDTALCSTFFKPIHFYIKVGFGLEVKPGLNANNIAVPYLRANAITGKYPNRKIDYSKVLLTRGKLPVPENAKVVVTDEGFLFTWDTSVEDGITHYSDQVMVMAHFTDLSKARFSTGGAQRYKGAHLLELPGIERGNTAEIYISFIESEHRSISNSVYLGQLNW